MPAHPQSFNIDKNILENIDNEYFDSEMQHKRNYQTTSRQSTPHSMTYEEFWKTVKERNEKIPFQAAICMSPEELLHKNNLSKPSSSSPFILVKKKTKESKNK